MPLVVLLTLALVEQVVEEQVEMKQEVELVQMELMD